MARYRSPKHTVSVKASSVIRKRIKTSEIPRLRDKFANKQGWRCPICTRNLRRLQLTLDHCHKTGYLRGTLCRNCNGIIGKIAGLLKRIDVAKIGEEQLLINMGLWHLPKNHKKKYIHPNAETLIERKNRLTKRAKKLKGIKK